MRVSIIGSNGFIASELIKLLLKKNFVINLLGTKKNYDIMENNNQINFYYFDFSNVEKINHNFFKTDIIINLLGSYSKRNLYHSNYLLPYQIFKQSLNFEIKKWINISSIGVYDNTKKIVNELTSLNPTNYYEETKLQLDTDLLKLSKRNNIPIVIIRPCSVIGKEMKTNIIIKLIHYIKNRLFFYIESDQYYANFLSINDLTLAIFCLVVNKNKYDVYNLAENITFKKLVELIKYKLKIKRKNFIIPKIIAILLSYIFLNNFLTRKRIVAMTNETKYSSKRILDEFDFKFSYGIEKEIIDIIDEKYSFRNNGH